MIQKRRALLAALIAGGSAVPAAAGCFDWLFHKDTPAVPVYPYAAGYAPATTVTPLGPPVPVGAPTLTAPVQAGAIQAPIGQAADMTPMAAPALATGGNGPGGYMSNFGGYRQATAAQMPAYGAQPINNPSVLTGLPVAPGTATAYYGGAPQTSYNAAAAYQAPATQVPMPQVPVPATPAPGGCFSRLFGKHYQTNYNAVPTTVYRPVQQVNPATGQTVIVQQPCTTTTQQVQRTPYMSLQPAQPVQTAPPPMTQPYYGEPGCGNEGPSYLSPGVSGPANSGAPQAMAQPGGYAPIGSGLSQATAIDGQGYAAPIPSTDAPTSAPLQGAPGGDAMPLEQPRLESSRPSVPPPLPPSQSTSTQPAQTTWRARQTPIENTSGFDAERPVNDRSAASRGGNRDYSDLPPIPAADDYDPPTWGAGSGEAPPTESQAPREYRPLSPPSLEGRTASRPLSEPARGPQAARYASSQRADAPRAYAPRNRQAAPSRPAQQGPRDSGGWVAIEP